MPVFADHHVALRVADIERATRFYVDALGGRALTAPFLRTGPDIEESMSGPPGLQVKIVPVAFDRGCVELFEFVEPAVPIPRAEQYERATMHMCFQVDDVAEALRRVEAAGGRRRWPIRSRGAFNVVYCDDPDGHVFELIDASMAEVVANVISLQPEAAPRA